MIQKIKNTFEYPTLRTTFIVGFPQESEADFEELMDFVKETRWDRMGAFTYSIEEDTPAYEMEQTVSEEEKQRRLDALMTLQNEIAYQNNQKYINTIQEVLVEGKDGLSNKYIGRSKSNAPDDVDGIVVFTSDRSIELGSFVQVKITSCEAYDCYGEEVQ